MARSRALKPVVSEALEDRTVPSGMSPWVGAVIGDVPSQDARQVAGQFQTFDQSFHNDFRTYISSLRSGSSTAADTFTTAIGNDVDALQAGVDGKIQNLAAANPNLTSTINGEIGTLKQDLTGLALPTSTHGRMTRTYLRQAFNDIEMTRDQVMGQVRSATPPANSISAQTVEQVLDNVLGNFRTFVTAYNSALKNSATNPATNRSAFDGAVSSALGTLNTNLGQSISTLPASVQSSLTTSFASDLLGSSSSTNTNLQARLAAIPSPSSGFFSNWWFRLRSYRAIGFAQSQVVHDLFMAVRTYNMAPPTSMP